MEYVVGVDIGGTFTDCVTLDTEGTVKVGKALSTPEDFSKGALNAVADAAKNIGLRDEAELLAATKMFFHACTVADNTLITRSGPKTGLITTLGFGDTILLMRGRTTEGLTETPSACVGERFSALRDRLPAPGRGSAAQMSKDSDNHWRIFDCSDDL
jgi:N-methylhydantoinase A/oxoprolinase/acetone carboxylase beta subunit